MSETPNDDQQIGSLLVKCANYLQRAEKAESALQDMQRELAQAKRVEKVCYDLHEALGVKWGEDPYAAIRSLAPAQEQQVAQDKPIAWRCTSMEGKRVVWVDHLMDEQTGANEIMLADEIIELYAGSMATGTQPTTGDARIIPEGVAAPAAQEQPVAYLREWKAGGALISTVDRSPDTDESLLEFNVKVTPLYAARPGAGIEPELELPYSREVAPAGSASPAAQEQPDMVPVAWAVRNEDGYWTGLWNSKEHAEAIRALGRHNEIVVPLYAAPAAQEQPKRRIEGCQHTIARMLEWIDEGACPICFVAIAGMRKQLLDQCAPYLKEGETPAQCIARNRKDVVGVLELLKQARAAAQEQPDMVQPQHHCGVMGWNPTLGDPPCPACTAPAVPATPQEQELREALKDAVNALKRVPEGQRTATEQMLLEDLSAHGG